MPEKRPADESEELRAPSTTMTEHPGAATEPLGAAAWYFSTVGRYVRNLLALPFRAAAGYFLQPQEIRVETVIREDGALKKRLVDARADSPSTPTSAGSSRTSPVHTSPSQRVAPQPGSRWRQRCQAAAEAAERRRLVTASMPVSPLVAHMARAKERAAARTGLLANSNINAPGITRPSFEKKISASVKSIHTPEGPASRPGRHVRFDDWEEVKTFSVPASPVLDEIYVDHEVNDVVEEYIQKKFEFLRREKRAALNADVDSESSDFKEEVGTPPHYSSPVQQLLPSMALIRELFERNEALAQQPQQEEKDSVIEEYESEDKELRANTLFNSLRLRPDDSMDEVDGPSLEYNDYMSNDIHHDSSSEFKEFVGEESSSEFKELVSSPPRASTPLDQSMRYLELAQDFLDGDVLVTSTPPPSSPVAAAPHTPSATPLVAPLTASECETLHKIAQQNATNDKAIVAELLATELTTHDFGTILPTMFKGHANGWLNDKIIDEYLELLVQHVKKKEGYVHIRGKDGVAPPVHAFKSQWFLSMTQNSGSTVRWARPANLSDTKLLQCNVVLIPVCDNLHWRLVAIKPKLRRIEYYDSLHGSGVKYTGAALDWVKGVLKGHFVQSEWSISEHQKSEEQVNARDCGIFTLLNALVLLRGEEHSRVQVTDGMDDARLRVAMSLIMGHVTTEMS
ncbi:cysteine proteinase [Bimuria novae-zelandiae CBS 107.79]|uniref:Cysteine proteinase n=1 Tax=Bimuria novae-zelandiae CBS 107.79 TaxID=1447943 RepID=A0A6A5UMK1_9PLEO|nr:cysteine proteinase [Bimuria novae-zelandiae CBS 107.79]